jgi:multimeric flavodoxin WrbA
LVRNIVCISGSNIKHAKEKSTSLKVCRLIETILNRETNKNITVQIIPLVEHELKPCVGCGKCYDQNQCAKDNVFNHIYGTLCSADALFIVAAHYAPIPSKLSMLLEKIEQIAFLKRFNQENYRSPLYRKPVGIIGHGGGTEEINKLYRISVIDNIWNALSYPVEMNIIGLDNEQPRGITFPVKEVKKNPLSFFPIQDYDWTDIETRLIPLVHNVINQVLN